MKPSLPDYESIKGSPVNTKTPKVESEKKTEKASEKVAPLLNKTPLEIDPELCSVTSDHQMVSDLFDFKELSGQDNFGIKRYKNGVYKGQINTDNNRHGFGVMVHSSGRTFEGNWLNDKRNGTGFELYKNGNHYRGEFLDNHAEGKGSYYWANGEEFEGEWKRSKKEGYGLWKGAEGESYIGEW